MATIYHRTARLALAFMTAVLAASALHAQDEFPSATISATNEGVTMPETVAEGLVNLVFENAGEAPFVPILVRLNDDVTMDDFMGAMSGDPSALTQMATLKGGTQVNPASTAEVTYEFTPGSYILINFAAQEPQMANFTVDDDPAVEAGSQTAPEADSTIALVDFAFGVPVTVTSGEQTWLLENRGEQWHEMVIYKIDDSLSLSDAKDLALQSLEGGDPTELGLEQVFLWLPMSEKERAWVNVNLEPGTYAVACYLPDVSANSEAQPGELPAAGATADATAEAGMDEMAMPHTHLEKGMIQFVTIK